jgi:hypothetical protein
LNSGINFLKKNFMELVYGLVDHVHDAGSRALRHSELMLAFYFSLDNMDFMRRKEYRGSNLYRSLRTRWLRFYENLI